MKSIRDIKILMKNSMMSPDIRYQVAHAEKNFIDIDMNIDEEKKSSSDETEKE